MTVMVGFVTYPVIKRSVSVPFIGEDGTVNEIPALVNKAQVLSTDTKYGQLEQLLFDYE